MIHRHWQRLKLAALPNTILPPLSQFHLLPVIQALERRKFLNYLEKDEAEFDHSYALLHTLIDANINKWIQRVQKDLATTLKSKPISITPPPDPEALDTEPLDLLQLWGLLMSAVTPAVLDPPGPSLDFSLPLFVCRQCGPGSEDAPASMGCFTPSLCLDFKEMCEHECKGACGEEEGGGGSFFSWNVWMFRVEEALDTSELATILQSGSIPSIGA